MTLKTLSLIAFAAVPENGITGKFFAVPAPSVGDSDSLRRR